jgi:serine/threonine-protein kinase HipA
MLGISARNERADIYKGEVLAGTLTRHENHISFEYTDEYLDSSLPPVSTTLPKTQQSVLTAGGAVPAFFAGLLPEGRRLVAIQRSLKTSPDDELSQLIAVGRDCIGDVRVLAHGSPLDSPLTFERAIGEPDQVSFSELFESSLEQGGDRSPSIPGVQDKLSDQMLSLPIRQKGAAVILKLSPPAYPRLVENENFFMGLASTCGLKVPHFEVIHDRDGQSGLVVERFDREHKRGVTTRLAQEDAVQLAGRWPASKYLMSTREVFQSVSTVAAAAPVAKFQLLKLFIYSYMIANGDLHAKNVSVFNKPNGVWSVTPAYDLVSTLPYGDDKMALLLDGRDSNIRGHEFVAFAESLGIREKVTRSLITEITDSAESGLHDIESIGLSDKKSNHLSRAIRERIADLRR